MTSSQMAPRRSLAPSQTHSIFHHRYPQASSQHRPLKDVWTVQRHVAKVWCPQIGEHMATSYFNCVDSTNPRMKIFSSERKTAFSARFKSCKSQHPFKLLQSLHGSLDVSGRKCPRHWHPSAWKKTTAVKGTFPNVTPRGRWDVSRF